MTAFRSDDYRSRLSHRVLSSLLFLVILSGQLTLLNAANDEAEAAAEKKTAWAEIVIKGSYPEGASMPGIFGAAVENLAKITERLDRAAADDEIAGLVLEIESPALGWGKLHELREAISRVRASGKTVIAVLTDADTQGYLLASACDRIAIPESGTLRDLQKIVPVKRPRQALAIQHGIGLKLGGTIRRRLSPELFRKLVIYMLMASGVLLLIRAV